MSQYHLHYPRTFIYWVKADTVFFTEYGEANCLNRSSVIVNSVIDTYCLLKIEIRDLSLNIKGVLLLLNFAPLQAKVFSEF